ncbi:MAG: hypothetical protein ABIA59_11170 [Candidatus Latescibacterota bacterium]
MKKQLKRIAKIRDRAVLVYAADLTKGSAPISISYPDLLPINDQLANINGDAIDLILETPGGQGEVVEDIVRLLRGKFKSVGVILPGWAKVPVLSSLWPVTKSLWTRLRPLASSMLNSLGRENTFLQTPFLRAWRKSKKR